MKSHAPLALMEQLVMVLVFALAAALCVQTFALSSHISRTGAARDRAVIEAQNAAELCKAEGFDAARLESQLSGRTEQGVVYTYYDENWETIGYLAEYAYCLQVQNVPAQPGLGKAEVRVSAVDGEVLSELSVAWQEVDGNA